MPHGQVQELLVIGTIHTLDPQRPRAEAALMRNGVFVCVGSRADCQRQASPDARVIDLGAGSAVPGLVDAHGHVHAYGLSLLEVSCAGAASEDACAARVAERARSVPAGTWIQGRGWDQNTWPGGRFPTAEALSKVAPAHPVALARVDGHAVWVNAKALEIAGIGKDTPEPAGGKIVRGPDGQPTGVLVDNAMELVRVKIPKPSAREIEDTLLHAMQALAAVGLTAVHDAGVDKDTLEVYRALAASDRMPLRVYAMLDGQAPMPELLAQMALWKKTPEVGWLTVRSVKMYADGALGSRGAALYEPYSDDPGNTGLRVTDQPELVRRVHEVVSRGFQPNVHAIGDRASAQVLEAFIGEGEAAKALRPRVEHLQILQPKDAPLLKQAGAIASMQPTHCTSDAPWAEERLGHGTPRQKGAYAWRQALDAGAVLALGSDFPIESPDPRAGLYSAETRRPATGNFGPEGWMPEQRLTRLEALRGFTAGAAYASFAEGRRGMIREGMDADLTAFGEDLLAVPADALPRIPIRLTVVGGRVAFEAK